MNPPTPPTPDLFTVTYYGVQTDVVRLTVQGYTYDTGTYFFFLPEGEIQAVSMEAVGYVNITPVPQGNDSSTVGGPAESEQTPDGGRKRNLPPSRWQLP